MRPPHWVLLMLIAALGCSSDFESGEPGDDDDSSASDDDDDSTVGDDDSAVYDPCEGADPLDPCCADALPTIFFGACEMPPDQEISGHFESWELGTVNFVSNDGPIYEFGLEGTPTSLAMLPNLWALGPLTLVQTGGCDGESGYYNAVWVYAPGDSSQTILVTGSSTIDEFAGWTIESLRDINTCIARPSDGCNEFMHNRAVHVEHGIESQQLFQGTEAIIEGFDVMIVAAQSGSGGYDCTDGPGTELDNWVIVPHVDR